MSPADDGAGEPSGPMLGRLRDGSLAAVIPAQDAAWLARILRAWGRRYWSETGGRPPIAFFRVRDVLEAAASDAGDRAVPVGLEGSPRRKVPASATGDPSTWLTTTEAAALLGLSRRRVQQLARAGSIQGARRLGRDWTIPATVVPAGSRGRGGEAPMSVLPVGDRGGG